MDKVNNLLILFGQELGTTNMIDQNSLKTNNKKANKNIKAQRLNL